MKYITSKKQLHADGRNYSANGPGYSSQCVMISFHVFMLISIFEICFFLITWISADCVPYFFGFIIGLWVIIFPLWLCIAYFMAWKQHRYTILIIVIGMNLHFTFFAMVYSFLTYRYAVAVRIMFAFLVNAFHFVWAIFSLRKKA